MRVIFMGTPQFAADVLTKLAEDESVEVCCVVTNADSVSRRGNKLVPTPVREIANEYNIDCVTPKTLRDDEVLDQLAAYNPDFICVAAYGKLLPAQVLQMPKYECLNVHGSLLPRWRGAAPIERAILAGDEQVGVSIMRMEEGLDTGAYCAQGAVSVEGKTSEQIKTSMASIGGELLLKSMEKIEEGLDTWTEQDESLVTYAEKLEKNELWLSDTDTREIALRKIMCASKSHAVKCKIGGRGVSLLSATTVEANVAAGKVALIQKKLVMGFTNGALQILKIQPDGKKLMDATAFASGVQGIKNGSNWGKY